MLDSDFEVNPQDTCRPMFHTMAVLNPELTKQEGRQVYEDVPFVQILIPGNSKDIVDRKVTDADKQRWPREWAAFEAKKEAPQTGTPLKVWPELSPSQIALLEHLHVRTVEDLAALSDAAMLEVGPGTRELQDKAKRFLKVSKDSSYTEGLEKQLADLQAQIDEMKKPKKGK